MTLIAWFIFVFALVRLMVATINLIFNPRLKSVNLKKEPFVSVLIPARNEEANITNILNDIIKQQYKNLEIIVFNDDSGDNTQHIVEQFSLENEEIRLINAGKLPEKWLGKNYACHVLGQNANGNYFLFLDADVRISDTLIANAVAHLQEKKLGLLSIFPVQQMKTTGEKIVVPVMNMILLTLLPLILVRVSQRPSLAAANGQFMLFDSLHYKKIRPHEKVKDNKVEDIAIARYYKKEGIRIDCLTGNDSIRCRMYKNYTEAVNGFSKNMAAFFGNSRLLAILYWLITTFGFIAILFKLSYIIFIIYLIISLFNIIFVSIISQQSIIMNLIFSIPRQWASGYINYKACRNYFLKSYKWKGRDIK
ncbi:MAG: glycosyltransferase family 2 protein [Bacteroidales bacterium]|nr:glycosyltransferase family 2 protein [Bacteroidales bacterium]